MSVTPSQIASGVAQTTYQQGQIARITDADRNRRLRIMQELREQQELQRESVEDSYETSDEHLTVRDDEEGRKEQGPPLPSGDGESGIDVTA